MHSMHINIIVNIQGVPGFAVNEARSCVFSHAIASWKARNLAPP